MGETAGSFAQIQAVVPNYFPGSHWISHYLKFINKSQFHLRMAQMNRDKKLLNFHPWVCFLIFCLTIQKVHIKYFSPGEKKALLQLSCELNWHFLHGTLFLLHRMCDLQTWIWLKEACHFKKNIWMYSLPIKFEFSSENSSFRKCVAVIWIRQFFSYLKTFLMSSVVVLIN